MRNIRLTITESACRSGHCAKGDTFIVGELCPPICAELWHIIYPYVFALQNGAALDYGDKSAKCFDACCPDGGRVRVHGELID